MNQQLESELRTALREHAGELPAAAVARLTHMDYCPRSGRLRPPVALGATALAAAAAGAAALIVSLGAGAGNAFAGWTAKPTKAPPAQVAAAAAGCAGSPTAGAPLKLIDTRGPFTFLIYADADSGATCIQGPGVSVVRASGSRAPVNVPAGRILLSPAHSASFRGPSFSFIDDRTGAGVSGVTLVLADGTNVRATVGNGWYIAWWPGLQRVKSAEVSTPSGVVTQTVTVPSVGVCRSSAPSGSCSTKSGPGGGSASGGGSHTVHLLPGSGGSR